MNRRKLQDKTIDELAESFAELVLSGAKAPCAEIQEIEDELKARGSEHSRDLMPLASHGDQRRALLSLYDHPNLQVRLIAVTNSLALAPEEDRRVLQAIADSREYPQAGDAGMCLRNLDEGIFKPT